MTCPACGHAAEAQAKFCSQCGRRLSGVDRPTPAPRSYTPAHLADKILSSRSALQGERKQVTVLFADVKGSLDLAAQVEAETWHEILDRFFAILADGIHRFEGTINQYTGDGIMALFGAPIAHEDHAQRACHAALALRGDLRGYADTIRREHGLSFSVRMGVNSGDVVVGRIGDDLRMDYTAQGHTVGLAARMEQLADPGTVFLSEVTAEIVRGYFALRDLGSAHVKGAAEPLRVYELEGPGPLRTRLDRSRARGFATFVGRSNEMAVLDDALEAAFQGRGGVVGVEGEAGVGKSRLCAEFVGHCRQRAVSVYEAHCPSHGRSVPFLPILALVRGYFGITERDDAASARERIAGRLLLRDDSVRETLPVLYDFLGVADPAKPALRMDPEARQRQLFTFVRRLAEPRRDDETVLLFLDDVHWIDDASDTFVTQLVDALRARRTLLLLNYRREYSAGWMSGAIFRRLPLAPLIPVAAEALLDDLVGTDPALSPLRSLILERTAGNPFFIEEVVQALFNDGSLASGPTGVTLARPLGDVRIPDTVHAVLASRIDQLTEVDKAVAQTAAVIGKAFDPRVLRRVLHEIGEDDGVDVDVALQRLVGVGLIHAVTAPTDGGFAFKHPLTQEVAYRSQLGSHRERVHRAVAQVLQELNADRLDEVAALLAHHWGQAHEGLEAARWHRRAAYWAGVSDIAAAAQHWRHVRQLVADLPDSPETIELRLHSGLRLLDLGWRLGLSPAAAEPLFTEGRALANKIGDTRAIAAFLNMYGLVVGMHGDVDGGLALVRDAAQLARESGDRELQLTTSIALVQAQAMTGALAEALQMVSEALGPEPFNLDLGLAGAVSFNPSLYLLMMRGHLHTEMGRLAEARTDLERVLTEGRRRDEIELLGWTHEMVVYLFLATRDLSLAGEHAEHAVAIAEKIGSPLSRASAYYSLGAVHLALGRSADAARAMERGLEIIREQHTGKHWEARGLALLAEALAGAGQHERARTTVNEAEAASLRNGDRPFECLSCLSVARVRLAIDGAAAREKIEASLDRLAAIIARSNVHLHEPWIHELRADLAAALGDAETRERELLAAKDLFAAIGAEKHAARVAELLARP